VVLEPEVPEEPVPPVEPVPEVPEDEVPPVLPVPVAAPVPEEVPEDVLGVTAVPEPEEVVLGVVLDGVLVVDGVLSVLVLDDFEDAAAEPIDVF
jgi:outer membrane biosynthesis protein TonB